MSARVFPIGFPSTEAVLPTTSTSIVCVARADGSVARAVGLLAQARAVSPSASSSLALPKPRLPASHRVLRMLRNLYSANLRRARDLAHAAGLVVLEGLLQLALGVHDERAVARHGLAERGTRQQQ